MEQFVKLLYDRLPDDKKIHLFMIMQNAINEMHNNGIIAQLTPELAARVHDPDPNVRVTEKTSLAKSIGKKYIPITQPLPRKEGGLAFMITVIYDARFVNAISICIQGGLEGLYQAGTYKNNPNEIIDYIIVPQYNGADLSPFLQNIEILNDLYPNFNLIVVQDKREDSVVQNQGKSVPPKKEGFFSKLFGK